MYLDIVNAILKNKHMKDDIKEINESIVKFYYKN